MESGISYSICHAHCKGCNYKWTAVIEVDYIELMGKKEYKFPDFLLCPECNSEFADYKGIKTNEDFKNNN
jgi:hypothetical protein